MQRLSLEGNMSSASSELITHRQFIRAGAGAGKTTRLIKTFYSFAKDFYSKHGRWPKVVLSTFTKKATQEIKERLLKLAIENNDSEFVSYLSKSSLVQISTIHLLLQNILFRFHDRISLINQIEIIDDTEELTQIFRLIKNEFVNSGEFIELVEHFRLSELTTLVRDSVRYKKEFPDFNYVPVKELEQITQSKVKELVLEWKNLLGDIQKHRVDLSLEWKNYFQSIDQYVSLLQEDRIQAAIKLFDQMESKPRFSKTKPPFPVELHETLDELRKKSEKSVTFADTEAFRFMYKDNHELFQRLLEKIFVQWQQLQKTTGKITIADLELLSLQIASNYPDEISGFAKEIDFIMLDEYQDTSPLQVKILQLIINQTNVFIVGDPQQSIYLFRGARTEVFLSQEVDSQRNNFEMISLQTNFRSHPEILQFFNDYFGLHSGQFVSMQPGPTKPSTFQSERIHFLESTDQLYSAMVHIVRLKKMGVDFKDVAVLSKKNEDLVTLNSMLKSISIPVDLQTAAGLERKREILDCVSFLKFIVNPYDEENLFNLLRSPWFFISDENLFELRKVQKERKLGSLWICLKSLAHPVFEKLSCYLNLYLQKGFLYSFENFIFEEKILTYSLALDDSGRMESNIFKFYQMLFENSLSKNFDLNQFINDKSFLGNTLESNGKSESAPASPKPAVKLMTIHGSKGLQFKHVIIIGMNDLIVPKNYLPLAFDQQKSQYALALTNPSDSKKVSHSWSQRLRQVYNQREVDESYRLLYVAMTRAEESICLISEDRRNSDQRTWKDMFFWPVISQEEVTTFKSSSIHIERHEVPQDLLKTLGADFSSQVEKSDVLKPLSLKLSKSSVSLSVSDLLNFNIHDIRNLRSKGSISKEKQEVGFKISEQLIDAQAKALAGTRAHTLFESIKFNNFLKDSQFLDVLTKEELLAVEYLRNLEDIPLQDILNSGAVEFGFKLKVSDYIIQGQIDGWGLVGSKVYLIDYKTGDKKHIEKAFSQLHLYAQCLAQMNLISEESEVILAAIFPFDGITVLRPASNIF